MKRAAEEQEFEQAANFRNRLNAVRSLLERQRVSNEAVGTLDAIAVAAEGTDANAQVFQVRDGVLADRQSFYLENAAGRDEAEVAEEFVLQYYASALVDPAAGDRAARRGERRGAREALSERRGGRWRCATPSGATSAGSSSWRSATHGSRWTRTGCAPSSAARQRIEALERAPEGARHGLSCPMRIECFDISNLGRSHRRVDGGLRGWRGQEVGLPALRHPGLRSG